MTVGLFQFADFHGAFVFSGGVQRTYEESPDADRGAMLERIFEARWYASKPLGDATYLATAYSKGSIAVWIRMVGRTDLPKLTRLAEEQYVRLPCRLRSAGRGRSLEWAARNRPYAATAGIRMEFRAGQSSTGQSRGPTTPGCWTRGRNWKG